MHLGNKNLCLSLLTTKVSYRPERGVNFTWFVFFHFFVPTFSASTKYQSVEQGIEHTVASDKCGTCRGVARGAKGAVAAPNF